MPRQTQRETLFDYPPDRPTLFDAGPYTKPSSAAPSSPPDFRIPPPDMKVAKGSRPGQPLWQRPQSQAHQLPMFMSAREIQHSYQPLEGDRQQVYDYREGEATNRPFTTAGHPNPEIRTNDRSAPFLKRQGTAGQTMSHYRNFDVPETDQQVWDRKLDEAMMPHYEYREVHEGFGATAGSKQTPGYETLMEHSSAPSFPRSSAGTATWESHQERVDEWVGQRQEMHHQQKWESDQWSLHDRLHEAMQPGGVGYTSAIHLGTGGPHGTSEKPQVYGAHHRIAAMSDIAPDRLLPVLHHRQFSEARSTTGVRNPAWRYS